MVDHPKELGHRTVRCKRRGDNGENDPRIITRHCCKYVAGEALASFCSCGLGNKRKQTTSVYESTTTFRIRRLVPNELVSRSSLKPYIFSSSVSGSFLGCAHSLSMAEHDHLTHRAQHPGSGHGSPPDGRKVHWLPGGIQFRLLFVLHARDGTQGQALGDLSHHK